MSRHAIRTAVLSLSIVAGLSAVALAPVASATSTPKSTTYYVGLGDSYAAGWQYAGQPANTELHGFANQVDAALAKQGHKMTLENFGCGGATTTSILSTVGCPDPTTGGPTYPTTTQEAAALAFISAHSGHIGLITISIGGNDFDGCVGNSSPAQCVLAAMPTMKANVETLVSDLRTAVGSSVPIIAITYPDSILGEWLNGSAGKGLASLSVTAFQAIINPTLAQAYATQNVSLVDVTTATGAYIPWTKTTKLKPYGKVPVAVADACTITWFCAKAGDIHPTPKGYTVIAGLVEKQYHSLVG